MSTFLGANNAKSTLAGGISDSATTASLAAGTGDLFPDPGAGEHFALTFISAVDTLQREIVYVTGRTGDAITAMLRGQEGTDAQAWNVNDLAQSLATAGWLASFMQAAEQQRQSFVWFLDTGAANAYVITPDPEVTAYTPGMCFEVEIANTNAGGASTLQVGSGPPAAIRDNGAVPAAGALAAGMTVGFVYGTNGFWNIAYGRSNAGVVQTGTTQMAAAAISGSMTVGTTLGVTGATSLAALTASGAAALNGGVTFPGGSINAGTGQLSATGAQFGSPSFLNPANAILTVENSSGAVQQLCYSGANAAVAALSIRLQSTAPVAQGFFYQAGNVGNITITASSTSYGTTSDEEWKERLGDYDPAEALAIIRADPTWKFRWNDRSPAPGGEAVGWGAQTSYRVSKDLAAPGGWYLPPVFSEPEWADEVRNDEGDVVLPRRIVKEPVELVPGRVAEPNEEGAIYRPWSVDQAKRTPYLWAVTPWAFDRIEQLERVVAQLAEAAGIRFDPPPVLPDGES